MTKNIFNFLRRPFLKNVIILTSGTAGAQVIAMLLSPIITRLYGPEAYGLMGTFSAFITIVLPVAALSYPMAIVLPKTDTEAKGLVKLSLYTTITITLVVTMVFFLFNDFIFEFFNIEKLTSFIYLIPVVIFFSGVSQIIEQWLIRKKKFAVSAKATFIQSLIVNGGKAGIGFFYPFGSVLIILTALKSVINAYLKLIIGKYNIKKVLSSIIREKVSIKQVSRKYKDFPMYRAPEALLSTISGNLPIMLLTVFFGPASAGFYSIGRTVLNTPTLLISKSLGDVFYPRISEAANNNENLSNLIIKATLILTLVGILPYGIIILFGPWIFELVFGEEWIVAGEYARWISLWAYFSFINRPSVRSLPVLSAQRFHLIYSIITLIVRISAMALGFYIFNSDIVAVALFGISGAVLNIGLVLITIFISKDYYRNK